MELYGAECSDLSNFNLIIDASFLTVERTAEIILAEYNSWLASGRCGKYSKAFVAPVSLYPTQSVCGVGNDESLQSIRENMKMNGYNPDFPVAAVHVDSFDYILDGHKRASCAIKNNIDLIPVVYKDGGLNSIEPDLFSEWEEFNGFKYLIYPVKSEP
jgi:hypothetical protein